MRALLALAVLMPLAFGLAACGNDDKTVVVNPQPNPTVVVPQAAPGTVCPPGAVCTKTCPGGTIC